MAVQRKSQKNAPGEKKPVSWVKIVAVGFVILVVVMCILSFCNFSNFFRDSPTTETVKEGDHVGVYFATNTEGKRVFSTPIDEDGRVTLFGTNATATPNITTDDISSFTIKVGDEDVPYKITPAEQNAIAKAIIGQNYNSSIAIEVKLDSSSSDIRDYKASDLEAAGCNMSTLKPGDVVTMVFPYTDEKGEAKKYARCGVVTKVADDLSGATLNLGSDSVIVSPFVKL